MLVDTLKWNEGTFLCNHICCSWPTQINMCSANSLSINGLSSTYLKVIQHSLAQIEALVCPSRKLSRFRQEANQHCNSSCIQWLRNRNDFLCHLPFLLFSSLTLLLLKQIICADVKLWFQGSLGEPYGSLFWCIYWENDATCNLILELRV